jgi:hypothetical protein
MEISGIISAILIGTLIGVLGRLVVPGRQHIGILADTDGVDWVEWLFQIALAAVGVAALSRVKALR